MSNHTPGPWFSPDGKTIKQDYRPIGLTEDAGCMIGSVMGGPTSGPAFIEIAEEVEANTRLIVAAPDLLEALEDLKRELILSDIDLGYVESHFRPWINKAESAVSRARGYLFCPMTNSNAARIGAMSGWIKCSERMPELPKGGGKARVIAYTPARAAQSFANGSRFLYWNGIDWRYFDGGRFEHRVTHWQPFLAPPTE